MLLDKLYRKFWQGIDKKDAARVAAEVIPEGVTAEFDIPYIQDGNPLHVMDVLYPSDAKQPLPVIIDIHGGGLMGGSKLGNRPYCFHLAKAGFLVFAMDYALSPEERYPAQLRDINISCLWIEENIEKYGGDKNNVFITGDSAGAFLALHEVLVIGDKNLADFYQLKQPNLKFNAVCLTSGMYDLYGGLSAILYPGILATYSKKKSIYNDKLDTRKVVKPELLPPCYLITSKEDMLHDMTEDFHNVLNEKGIEHGYVDYEKRPDQKLEHVFAILHPTTDAGQICINGMLDFFRSYIR